jgi:hypothetical protein
MRYQQPIVTPESGIVTMPWYAWFRDVAKTITDLAISFVTGTLSATTVTVGGEGSFTACDHDTPNGLDLNCDLHVLGNRWTTAGDIARVRIGGLQHGLANIWGTGLRICTYKAGSTGTMSYNSFDAVAIDETTGKVTLAGHLETAGAWDDLVIPAVSVNPVGLPSPMTQITDPTGWLGCLLAAAAGTPTCVFQFQLSHSTQLGQDLSAHIHWVKDDALDVAGTVVWEADFRHLPLNGAASAWSGYSAGTLVLDPGDVRNKAAVTSWTLSNATYNFGISDILVMVLRRNGGTSGDAVVISGDVHYKKVRLGSLHETSLT